MKKYLSMLLVAVLALEIAFLGQSADMTLAAGKNETTYAETGFSSDVLDKEEYPIYDTSDAENAQKTELLSDLWVHNVESIYSVNAMEGVNYGEQILSFSGLTRSERKDAKAVYDKLKEIDASTRELTINVPEEYTFYTATATPTKEELADARAYVQRITQTAIDAFLRDYPEVFWIDVANSQWSFNWWYQGTGGSYTNTIKQVVYFITPASQYTPVVDYKATLDDAIKNFPVSGSNRYEKIKSIHDQLCRQNVYLEDEYSHQVYGGLVSGKSVCEGYAKAFKVICDQEGIPCVLVSGMSRNNSGKMEPHMWNYVQMENNKWYAVDVTWDDNAKKIYYDFFLSGRSTLATHFGNVRFHSNHIPNGDFNGAGIGEFSYPELPENAYGVEEDKLPAVTNLTVKPYGKEKTYISWKKVAGAEGYIVYRRVGSSGAFSYLYMTGNSYYIDSKASGTQYNFYRIYPYYKNSGGTRVLGISDKYVYAKGTIGAATGLAAKAYGKEQTYVSWNKVEDAEGYIIYRRVGKGAFTYVHMTGNTYYLDKKASETQYNYYRVYPYYKDASGSRILGPTDTYVYAKGVLPQVTGLKAKNNIGSISVSWNPVSGADGYIVYRRVGNGSFAYCAMTTKANNTSFVDKTASKTAYNYYRVYPYYTKDGKRILNQQSDYVYGKAK